MFLLKKSRTDKILKELEAFFHGQRVLQRFLFATRKSANIDVSRNPCFVKDFFVAFMMAPKAGRVSMDCVGKDGMEKSIVCKDIDMFFSEMRGVSYVTRLWYSNKSVKNADSFHSLDIGFDTMDKDFLKDGKKYEDMYYSFRKTDSGRQLLAAIPIGNGGICFRMTENRKYDERKVLDYVGHKLRMFQEPVL